MSLKRTGNPPMSSAVSTTSLVVPAMGETMAAGLWPGYKNHKDDNIIHFSFSLVFSLSSDFTHDTVCLYLSVCMSMSLSIPPSACLPLIS